MCEASCLPGRILRFKWKRDRLCFLSHRDFAFGLSLPLCWLVERVSKKPYHVFPFSLHFLCTKSKMHIFFSPAQGNARKRKCAKPQCKKQCLLCCRAFSQQTGRQHAHIGKKQRRETHSTHSGVPKDYFCSCQPAPSLDNNEGMLLWEAPYVQPHFADRAFATAVLDPSIFQPGSSIF